jgi:hypothetical protein
VRSKNIFPNQFGCRLGPIQKVLTSASIRRQSPTSLLFILIYFFYFLLNPRSFKSRFVPVNASRRKWFNTPDLIWLLYLGFSPFNAVNKIRRPAKKMSFSYYSSINSKYVLYQPTGEGKTMFSEFDNISMILFIRGISALW